MRLRWWPLVAALAISSGAVSSADALRKVLPEDLFALALIDDAQISHDGRQVAFVVTRLDGPHNRYRSAIWLAPADASAQPRQITQGQNDETPRWSPDDGTLAFVRRAAGKPQIYALDLRRGGEAQALTSAKDGARDPIWSHDGKRILFHATLRDPQGKAEVDWQIPDI